MKTIILTVAILTSSLFNVARATETVNMNELLKETVTFKNDELNIQKDKTEFVKISFKVSENGKVEILQMNYSNKNIKTKLVKQLLEMNIHGIIDVNETYNYNFTFMKK